MSKKLLIKTWGCQMNEYDSSKMADLLNAANGYELTEEPEEADVLLLNTCSIREKAQEKVFHQLGRWKDLKKHKPELIIGVGGCVADVSVDDGSICGEDVGVFILGVTNVLSLVSSEDTGTNLVPCVYLNGLLAPK